MSHSVIATLSLSALATVYNNLAVIVDANEIKKFADRAKGIKRTSDMFDKVAAYRAEEGFPAVEVAADGKLFVVEPPAPVAPVEPVAPVAAPAPAKAPRKVSPRSASVGDSDVILVAVSGNPKFGSAADRFAKYITGATVAEYIAALGGDRKQALRDLAWDRRQKWVSVVGANSAPAKAALSVAAVAKVPAQGDDSGTKLLPAPVALLLLAPPSAYSLGA